MGTVDILIVRNYIAYHSPNTARIIKSIHLRWTGPVAGSEGSINASKIDL